MPFRWATLSRWRLSRPRPQRSEQPVRRAIAAGTFGPSALLTPANAVSMTRVLAPPVLIAMIAAGGASWPAVVFWFLLSTTDGLDGWLARRHGTTRSGAFLDP